MSGFLEEYSEKEIKELIDYSKTLTDENILKAIEDDGFSNERAIALLSDKALNHLEPMAKRSMEITRQRFGNIINIFTPMYLNNFCINGCLYCGFNAQLPDDRVKMTVKQAVKEAEIIASKGISQLLLVAGEDPKGISAEYISELAKEISPMFSSVGIELAPFKLSEYGLMKDAGIDYVAFYQETFSKEAYEIYHLKGPKKDYRKRINNIDNIGKNKMSKIGMGVLLGLWDYKFDMLSLLQHINYVYKHYTFSQVSVSFPRIQPSASTDGYKKVIQKFNIEPVTEKRLAQAMFAVRLLFPDASITLSTRESRTFRDNMIPLVVTNMSAASKTCPGAYSFDTENLAQFDISDDRTLEEIKSMLKSKGLDSVIYERQYER